MNSRLRAGVRALIRIIVALLPLTFTPLLGLLLANGKLNFGGGEKDILLILPWALGSLIYGISCFVLWYRSWSLGRAVFCSIGVSFAALVIVGFALAFIGILGVGAHF
jgi:hypothetical protein